MKRGRSFVELDTRRRLVGEAIIAVGAVAAGSAFLIKAPDFWVSWLVGPSLVLIGAFFLRDLWRRFRAPGAELFRVDVHDGVVSWPADGHETVVPLAEVRKISLSVDSDSSSLTFDLPGLSVMLVNRDFRQFAELFAHLASVYDGPMFHNGKPHERSPRGLITDA